MNYLLDALLANALVALFLAVLAALIASRVRRPALVHALWLIVLLKLITPPLFSLHWPLNAPQTAEESTADAEDEESVALSPAYTAPPDEDVATTRQQLVEALVALRIERESVLATGSLTPSTPPPWNNRQLLRTILGSIWLGGTLVWFSVFAWRIVRFHRLLALGQPAENALQTHALELAARIGLHRCPQVWIVPGRVSPLLWMIGRRGRLVLPAQLLENLNHDQQAALLTHEMAHAHRLDHWVRWVELCALGFYWWNPVAWWACRELHQAEEECCDAWVVWILPGAARAYAKALLQTVTFLDARPCLPPVASGAGHVSLLKRRVSMIVKEPLSPRLPKPLFFAALIWGLLVLPFAPERVIANSIAPEEGLQTSQRQSNQSVEQRIQAIENKLDKVLKALDAQSSGDSKAKQAAEGAHRDEQRSMQRAQEAEARAKEIAEQVKKMTAEARARAQEQAAEARAAADQARKALEAARSEMQKQVQQQRETAVRAARQAQSALKEAKATEDKEKAGKDDKKTERTERRVIVTSPNMDAKAKAELERIIKEKIGTELKVEELKKVIQDSVDPAKMKQIQGQVHEILRKTMDEKRKEMDKAFDEVRKTLESQRVIMQMKQADESKAQGEVRSRVSATNSARDGDLRDMQRRLDRLEQRLDKVISSLESQQREKRERPNQGLERP
ncbi:MAG TPA: M56 family metallopeptidase [Gemmataceae bacterium]|jgi:beta-lactamase regulating signal transducer with metallopeptidase domain|nr:M56 family metallopeptidase [Gemmataceae bacterium]